MKGKKLNIYSLITLVSTGLTGQEFSTPESRPDTPNILVIMADDMGWGDLGCTGSEVMKTPNIDRLADNGVLFTSAYVTGSVCAPSRAGFLTGRFPQRFGFENNLDNWNNSKPNREEFHGLHLSELTIADHLKAAGYQTSLIGKWHQGKSDVHHPNQRGFDYFCGMLGGSHNYFPEKNKHRIERNGEKVNSFTSPYLTDFFTDEAVGWIENKADHPWFMFLSYNAPHTPMQASGQDLEACSHIRDEGRRTYAAMVYALDRGVGRIISKLQELGIYENTLIVFLSDNGGATNNHSWNGPFSGCKGNCREGGIRAPMIWQWPSGIPAGKTCKEVVSSLDLLPSFLYAVNARPIKAFDMQGKRKTVRTYDGMNLIPLVRGEQEAGERRLFWRLQGQAAILDGKDKLIRLDHKPAQYFRPAKDLSESYDLSNTNRERFIELYQLLFEWETNLPTDPHFFTSPYWSGQSAKNYEEFTPKPEPK